jgi:hypothetical protein
MIPVFQHYYSFISGEAETVDLIYQSDLSSFSFNELLKNAKKNDFASQYTTTGIHKDDLQLHLESDFILADGFDKMWLHKAVKFFETHQPNYLYLRKFLSDAEMAHHWFHQWREQLSDTHGPFQHCENFWWSNNPALFDYRKLKQSGTLPLNETLDGPKNSDNWSRPELSTMRPRRAWMWGFGEGPFVHEG